MFHRRLCIRLASLALFATLSGQAVAGDELYLDDRSSPDRLVQSLYNAINRKEYARAWSYFSAPPAKTYEDYVKGFAKTDHVDVKTGAIAADGAAGSTFFNIAVAIQSSGEGEDAVFGGCYVIRQVNGTIQDPPFKPLMIESGKLKAAPDKGMDEAIPSSCGDGEAMDPDDVIFDQAQRRFTAEMDQQCYMPSYPGADDRQPAMYKLSYKESYAAAEDPPRKVLLFVFPCGMGAYNSTEAYYIWDTLDGLRPLSFATPQFDLKYEDDLSEKLKSISLKGFSASNVLVNSEFDEKTSSITMFSKWRGLADASSNGTWMFDEGEFILKNYDVDPTYDGEMNDIPVIKDGHVLQLP